MEDDYIEAWLKLRDIAQITLRKGTTLPQQREWPYLQFVATGLHLRWYAYCFELLTTSEGCYVVITKWIDDVIDQDIAKFQESTKHLENLAQFRPTLVTQTARLYCDFTSESIERFRAFPVSGTRVRAKERDGVEQELTIRGIDFGMHYSVSLFRPLEWELFHSAILRDIERQVWQMTGLFV
jgi:hypothetical protein